MSGQAAAEQERQPKADVEAKSQPLSEKLTQLVDTIASVRKTAPVAVPRVVLAKSCQPNFETPSRCLVCGMFRLDPDPTGITCGNPQCLLQIGADHAERVDAVKLLSPIAEKAGLKREDLDEDPEEIARQIKEAIPDVGSLVGELKEMAGKLGLDPKDLPEDPPDAIVELLEIIGEEVESLHRAVQELEEGLR